VNWMRWNLRWKTGDGRTSRVLASPAPGDQAMAAGEEADEELVVASRWPTITLPSSRSIRLGSRDLLDDLSLVLEDIDAVRHGHSLVMIDG